MSDRQLDYSHYRHTTPEEITSQQEQVFPLYKVILHHDGNEITYTMFALYYAVYNLTLCEAEQIALAAHLTGQAVVAVCPKELAEYYRERIINYHLTTTIEPS